MLKELLSDFSIIAKPTYQPENFSPYLTTIITIVTVTLVAFSIQTIAVSIYTYSSKPVTAQSSTVQSDTCANLLNVAKVFCSKKVQGNYSYVPKPSGAVEHDLHNLMN